MITALDIWRHRAALMRYARTLTRSHDQAEDLTSDTILRAVEKAHLFREERNLLGWLMKIMHNIRASQARSAARDRAYRGVLVHVHGHAVPPAQLNAVRVNDTIEGIRMLPDKQALTLCLLVHGMSVKNAAAVSDAPVGTIISRAYRARRFLKAREAA